MVMPPGTRPFRMLIVDDEVDFVSNLCDILGEFGYQVDSATSAAEALRLAHDHRYDVAVLDFRMPETNGIELHDQLCRLQGGLPAVLLTAYADQETQRAAREAGFWQIMEKPLEVPAIAEFLTKLVEQPILLLVDDEPDFSTNLVQILQQHRVRVWAANSIKEALEHLSANRFDLVLLDVQFPNESPDELVTRAQQLPKSPTIILMSGYAEDTDPEVHRLRSLGIERFYPKPLDVSHLVRTICGSTPPLPPGPPTSRS